jgi:hypothetical protein
MSRRVRRIVGWSVGLLVAITILAALTPESAGPGRLVVLHRFLGNLGVSVSDADDPPSQGAYLLPVDRRSSLQIESLLSWVEQGGRLIVTDPSSAIFDRFGVEDGRVGVFGDVTMPIDCVRSDTLGVGAIEVSASDRLLTTTQGAGCFARGDGSFVLFVPHGAGTVVLAGGPSFLTDELLNHADNATFVADLVGPGPVVIGPSGAAVTSSVWEAIPAPAKAVFWELVVAVTLFALARGRRLDKPLDEEPVSPIPSGELVDASARLYRRARAAGFCGRVLREWTAARLTRRTGVAPDADRARLAEAIARASDVPVDRLEQALAGPDLTTDRQLVELGRELESIAEQIEGATR